MVRFVLLNMVIFCASPRLSPSCRIASVPPFRVTLFVPSGLLPPSAVRASSVPAKTFHAPTELAAPPMVPLPVPVRNTVPAPILLSVRPVAVRVPAKTA